MEYRDDLRQRLLDGLSETEQHQTLQTMEAVQVRKLARLRASGDTISDEASTETASEFD
jgi:hypothetical protein